MCPAHFNSTKNCARFFVYSYRVHISDAGSRFKVSTTIKIYDMPSYSMIRYDTWRGMIAVGHIFRWLPITTSLLLLVLLLLLLLFTITIAITFTTTTSVMLHCSAKYCNYVQFRLRYRTFWCHDTVLPYYFCTLLPCAIVGALNVIWYNCSITRAWNVASLVFKVFYCILFHCSSLCYLLFCFILFSFVWNLFVASYWLL